MGSRPPMRTTVRPETKIVGTPRKPVVAALLSLLTSGLGQVYNGELVKGVVLFVVAWGLLLVWEWAGLRDTFQGLVVGATLLLGGVLVQGYSIVDAFRKARQKSDYRWKAYNRWYVYVAPILTVGTLELALLQLVPARTYRNYHISSPSMQPTLRPGDYVSARWSEAEVAEPERGEIVVYAFPPDPSRDFLHRVVGLPGETLSIVDGQLFVDRAPLEEPYVVSDEAVGGTVDPGLDNMPSTLVPEGHCFVMGDNRHNSIDSRYFGPLPMENLRGRPLYVYWSSDRSRIGTSLLPQPPQ